MGVNSIISRRNPSLYCTFTLTTMQVHKNRGKKTHTMNLSITLCYIAFEISLLVVL